MSRRRRNRSNAVLGFNLKEEVIYNNKILTVIFDSLMDCFRTMDIIDSHEDHPYVQIYSEGELLTDNLENLREDYGSGYL